MGAYADFSAYVAEINDLLCSVRVRSVRVAQNTLNAAPYLAYIQGKFARLYDLNLPVTG